MTHDDTSALMGKFKQIRAMKIHNRRQPSFAIDHNTQFVIAWAAEKRVKRTLQIA